MAIVATNLKKGQCIRYEGDMGIVLGLEHRTPGKGNALIAATIRSFNNGNKKTIRFSSSEKVDIVDTDRQKLEFSYTDSSGYNFMDLNTYETITLHDDLVGDTKALMKEGQEVEVLFIDGNPVSIDLPAVVELKVTDSSEGIKGDTANNPTKPATLETGITVQVPLFVKPDDVLKINTTDSSYVAGAELVADGARNKEIAYKLGITERTVRAHLSHIFQKLEVDSRAAAAAEGVRRGIV